MEQLKFEWFCDCRPGFAGPDCGQVTELSCNDQVDNDLDGLVDCEDEDCCQQSSCRDNLMCFTSPEPSSVLANKSSWQFNGIEQQQQVLFGGHLFRQWNFLIENNSVQSYAQEGAFVRSRVAVLRGRVGAPGVAHWPGLVSIRIGVLEHITFGFTLTRPDGHFDLLVNGDEWLTLSFHRQAYAPLKRRVFVRAHRINLLEEEVKMWQANGQQQAADAQQHDQSVLGRSPSIPFYGLGAALELAGASSAQHTKVLASSRPRLATAAGECLIERLMRSARPISVQPAPAWRQPEPRIVLHHSAGGPATLRAFALASASSSAFRVALDTKQPIGSIVYNSAQASAAPKPSVTIQLLPNSFGANTSQAGPVQLHSIKLSLDIEGQSRSVRFGRAELVPGLSYVFAWDRRNVYGQKVFGFSELSVRLAYEYSMGQEPARVAEAVRHCSLELQQQQQSSAELVELAARLAPRIGRHTVVLQRRLFMEANMAADQAQLGRWRLDSSRSYDAERELLSFGADWMLPLRLAYPPVLGPPLSLASWEPIATPPPSEPSSSSSSSDHLQVPSGAKPLARGPNSSMFVLVRETPTQQARLVQFSIGAGKQRKLLDLPLAILTSKFGPRTPTTGSSNNNNNNQQQQHIHMEQNLHLLYNHFDSSLYIGSKLAGKLISVPMSSLLLLEKTLNSDPTVAPTLGADEEIDIELVCGHFGAQSSSRRAQAGGQPEQQQQQQRQQAPALVRRCVGAQFESIHSLSLDERNQLLYFVAGSSSIHALDLRTNSVVQLSRLLELGQGQQQQQQQPNRMNPLDGQCPRTRGHWRRFVAQHFKAQQIRSLAWSEADSSLYFVDQNAVFALRQDASIDLIALGAGGQTLLGQPESSLRAALSLACRDQLASGREQLGSIKSIALDQSAGFELLVVHRKLSSPSWPEAQISDSGGQFYLAKLALGIKCAGSGGGGGDGKDDDDDDDDQHHHASQPAGPQISIFDLHSSESTWNPLIGRVASLPSGANISINDWLHLAGRPNSDGGAHSIPFIHLMRSGPFGGQQPNGGPHLAGGFQRADSIESCPLDGSIFVLDWARQSVRQVRAYSPGEFNKAQQHNYNQAAPAAHFGLGQMGALRRPTAGSQSMVLVRNPLDVRQEMEFHWPSGLQIGQRRLAPAGSAVLSRLAFEYEILTRTDKNDFDDDDNGQQQDPKLLAYISSLEQGPTLSGTGRRLVALSKVTNYDLILGSTTEFRLDRQHDGLRSEVKYIQMNGAPMCELNTDQNGLLTTFIEQPAQANWTELAYDPKSFLLESVIVKTKPPFDGLAAAEQQQSRPHMWLSTAFVRLSPDATGEQDQRLKRSTRRISYDSIFNHYCDLILDDV